MTTENKYTTTEFLNFSEKLVHRTFDIRNGEGIRVALMWLYIFFVISSLLIIKPVVTSLFLSKFGANRLAYVFILIAVFAAPTSIYYSRLLRKIILYTVIRQTLQIGLVFLLIFRLFLMFNFAEGWILYIFYVFVAIFAVVSSSQFWIFANLLFNAREAKRLFGFIGSGAIAGGVFGGYLTNIFAPIIGSENLIFVCILFLVLCIPIIEKLWRDYMAYGEHSATIKQQSERIVESPVQLLRTSRHLFFLACLVCIGVIVGKIVEYQFSAIASMHILNEDELTAFFGFWLSNLNIISLLIQLFVTRRVVGVFGVGSSLYLLPLGILFGSLALLISPVLWAAIFIKISDGSLKNSVNKAGMELLALPIPLEVKNTAKSFIDVFVDSFATGISGIILGILAIGFNFSVREISLFIILLLSIWVYLVYRIRHEYIQTFRMKLISSEDKSQEMPLDIEKESVFGGLLKILDGEDEQQILQVLRMVKTINNDRLLPSFKKLLSHPSNKIQIDVLKNIYFYKHVDFSENVKELVYREDIEVKTEALHYLFQHEVEKRSQVLMVYMNHADYKIRGAALLCAARESRSNQKLKEQFKIESVVVDALKQLSKITDPEKIKFSKIICAKSIGSADISSLYPYLHFLFNDESKEVVRAAIESAGQARKAEYVPVLIRLLKRKELWPITQQALSQFGNEIIPNLHVQLSNPYVNKDIRLGIPHILFLLGSQKAVDVLIQNLGIHDISVRYEVIQALYQLRLTYPFLKFREAAIEKRIFEESTNYLNTLSFLYSQTKVSDKRIEEKNNYEQVQKARLQLVETLEKRLDHNLERIFRLLGLTYPPEDIETSYSGIKSNKPDVRINAVEFLDNLLEMNLKKVIVPIAESALVGAVVDESAKILGLQIKSEFDCLITLLACEDPKLQSRTLTLISQLKDDRYLPFLGGLLNSPDEDVREMARFTVRKLGIIT